MLREIWEEYCSCLNAGKETCLICQFRRLYFDDQFKLFEHCFGFNYLVQFHYHLFENLQRLFKENTHILLVD